MNYVPLVYVLASVGKVLPLDFKGPGQVVKIVEDRSDARNTRAAKTQELGRYSKKVSSTAVYHKSRIYASCIPSRLQEKLLICTKVHVGRWTTSSLSA